MSAGPPRCPRRLFSNHGKAVGTRIQDNLQSAEAIGALLPRGTSGTQAPAAARAGREHDRKFFFLYLVSIIMTLKVTVSVTVPYVG